MLDKKTLYRKIREYLQKILIALVSNNNFSPLHPK